MRHNHVCVSLWGKEICSLEWSEGYEKQSPKQGSLLNFFSSYGDTPWDLDPLGKFGKKTPLFRFCKPVFCPDSEYEGIPRFMSSSLPDHWGNAVFVAWAVKNGIQRWEITALDKLSFIGNRGMGALEFVPYTHHASGRDALILEQLYETALSIKKEREGFSVRLDDHPDIKELMTVGTSTGGVHPKAVIAINWNTSEVRSGQVDLPEGFTHYILKFRHSNIWPSAEMEYAFYLMATKGGIQMMPCRLMEIRGCNHFLTQRFDRDDGGKIHIATLNALCGQIHSYEDIFTAAKRIGVPHADIVQLFRRAVFNYLAGVCDDHDKNFSFSMNRNGVWRLSPAYDLAFTADLKNPSNGYHHAMAIAGKTHSVTEEDFIDLAEKNDIPDAREIIRQVQDAVRSFRDCAVEAAVPEPVIEAVDNGSFGSWR